MDVVVFVVKVQRGLREDISDGSGARSGILYLNTIAYFSKSAITQTANWFNEFLTTIQSRFLPRIPEGLRLGQCIAKALLGFLTSPLVVGKSGKVE